MEETKFKPGDVVRLKSGGPLMTVEKVLVDDKVRVVWVAGGHYRGDYATPQYADLRVDVLKLETES